MASPDIYLNPLTHDLSITNGESRLTQNDIESVGQKVKITLNTFKGEWFANVNYGLPYLQNATNNLQLLSKTTQNIMDFEIKKAVGGTEGVEEIQGYQSNFNQFTRTLTVEFTAIAEDLSPITISTEI